MAKIVTRPGVREVSTGSTFAVAELSSTTVGATVVTTRAFPSYSVAASSSLAVNGETIQLAFAPTAAQTAALITSFYLDAGTVLAFGSNTITIATGITLTTTPQAVDILPATATVASAATATTTGAVFVVGASKAEISPDIKSVEATTYLSGTGKEMVVTANSRKISIECQLIYGDRGGQLLKKICYDPSYNGREFYFEILYPSGEKHQGIALLNSASTQSQVQDLRKITAEAMVQGLAYSFTNSTVTIP